MFRIDFDRSSVRELSKKKAEVLDSVDEMNLRYAYFPADVNFAADGLSESLPGTTLLDFMFCLLGAADNVLQGSDGRVSFTENDTVITFHPEGGLLTILPSWAPAPGQCTTEDFLGAVRPFVEEGLKFIVGKYPLFAKNATYGKLLALSAELQLPSQ